MKKIHDTCTVANCSFEHHARGLCASHYAQFKRGVTEFDAIKTRAVDKPVECIEEGCAAEVKAKGLCKAHYQRLLRHGHTKYRDRTKPAKECCISGCDHVLYSNGMCSNHYQKDRRMSVYGLRLMDYFNMFAEQQGVCKICNKPEVRVDGASGKLRDLSVDHCHATNAVRGLLCSSCNTGLGLFKDNPDLLKAAIEYLSQPEWFKPQEI